MRFLSAFIVLAALAGCARQEPVGTAPAPLRSTDESSHLLLTVQLDGERVMVAQAVRVAQPLPHLKEPLPPTGFRFQVRDGANVLIHEENIPAPNVLRGEFAGADGRTEGHHFTQSTGVFPARIPNAGQVVEVLAQRKMLAAEDARHEGAPEEWVSLGRAAVPEALK